jgi:hypothetical protein
LLAQVLAGRVELLEALRDDPPDADRHAVTPAARATRRQGARTSVTSASRPRRPGRSHTIHAAQHRSGGGRPTRWQRHDVRRGTPTSP